MRPTAVCALLSSSSVTCPASGNDSATSSAAGASSCSLPLGLSATHALSPVSQLPFTTRQLVLALVMLGAVVLSPVVEAADSETHSGGVLSFKLENDILSSGDDGHYTNGFALSYTFETPHQHWSRSLADWVPGFSAARLDATAYRFGQQIYTPTNIDRKQPDSDDRPYAGYLFGGVSLFAEENGQKGGNRWRRVDTFNLDLGIVGPASGAKSTQQAAHNITGSDDPEGWDHQLNNEPVVNAGWQTQLWLPAQMGSLEMEYGPSASAALGNLYTYAGVGGGIRIGQGLSRSYGIPTVAPSQSGRQYFVPDGDFAWYLFANLEGRAVARNMLLDGNSFEDSASVDRRPLVGDIQLGFALSWQRWQLAFVNVWRTHEFETQRESDQFGSLTLSTWL